MVAFILHTKVGQYSCYLGCLYFKTNTYHKKLPYQYHMDIDEYETSNKYYVQLYMYNEEKVKGLTHSSIILQFAIALHFITQLNIYLINI